MAITIETNVKRPARVGPGAKRGEIREALDALKASGNMDASFVTSTSRQNLSVVAFRAGVKVSAMKEPDGRLRVWLA